MSANEAMERIDAFCDAVPRRRARAYEHGPLVLFVPTGPGWPYYARPRRGRRPPVTASDVRAGAALVLAGLAADGETVVHGCEHVDRGYSDLPATLRRLGADVERM